MAGIRHDLRYALRSLRAAPAFTLVAALTLGLGIGANTAMVGLFDALLIRPPEGVLEPGGVTRVMAEMPSPRGGPPELVSALSYPHFRALREGAGGFGEVAAFAVSPLSVGEGDGVRNEEVVLSSGSYFPLLGVRAAHGRLIQPDDDAEGAPNPVAVLSWDYWRRAYGGEATAVGKTVRVGGQSLTIVGVAPKGFAGVGLGSPALWAPLSMAGSLGYDEAMLRSPFVSWLSVVGRLAPGGTVERATATAQAALLAAAEEGATAIPPRMGGGGIPGGRVMIQMRRGPGGPGGEGAAPAPPAPRVRLTGIGGAGEDFGGPRGGPPVQLWYLAVTAAVLLIACANVANLLLARGAYRSHELAVRLSMGATPARIARQLATESVVLGALGALAGFAVALGVWRLLPALVEMPPLPSLLDLRTLAVVAGLALATVLLFGAAPLLGLRSPEIRGVLGRSAPAVSRRSRGKSALVVAQLAMSVVLLIGAGLFIRSFQQLRSVDLGYDRSGLAVVTADTRGAGWTPERARDFWERAEERLARIPGVRGVSAGAAAPYMMNIQAPYYAASAGEVNPGDVEPSGMDFVAPDFFATLGIPIAEGRAFTAEDREGSARVAVVSRAFAREHFAGASPVGQCIRTGRDAGCIEVVGVAGDARFGELTDASPLFVYMPIEQRPAMAAGERVLHLRGDGDPGELARRVRAELRAVDAAPVEVRAIDELLASQLAPWRASAILFSVFGGLGVVLAAVGLYGVVAFLVARRTREIGIRVALGATRRDVLREVLGDAGRLVAGGAALGLLLSLGATRVFRSALYGVSTLDPVVYAGTAALLALIGLLAALSPARRAIRVDPMVALRTG